MSQTSVTEHIIPHMVDTNKPPVIVLDKVNKWFGPLHVLRDIDLDIAAGEDPVLLLASTVVIDMVCHDKKNH